MKKIVLISFFFIPYFCFSQQRSHYSQYLQNMSVINPAVTGLSNGFDLRMGLRNQWQDVTDAPKTSYLSLSSPIFLGGDMSKISLSDLGVADPATHDDATAYISSPSHHAIGVLAVNDKTGPISRLAFNFTYAYHIQVSDVFNLATGFGVGIDRVTLNASSLKFEEDDDPVVGTADRYHKMVPDLNLGVYLYGSNLYLGASIQQVLPNKLYFSDQDNMGKDVAHYFVTGGYKVWVSEDIGIIPSVVVKKVSPLPIAYDLNLKASYQNKFWIGGSYRKGDAVATMLGLSIANSATIGYAYDYTLSEIRQISSGTHEITLGLRF